MRFDEFAALARDLAGGWVEKFEIKWRGGGCCIRHLDLALEELDSLGSGVGNLAYFVAKND